MAVNFCCLCLLTDKSSDEKPTMKCNVLSSLLPVLKAYSGVLSIVYLTLDCGQFGY